MLAGPPAWATQAGAAPRPAPVPTSDPAAQTRQQAPAQPPPVAEKPAPPQAPPAAAPAPGAQNPVRTESYSYDPSGRRDPFLNLLGTGSEPRINSRRGEGPAGLSINEISVRGVMLSSGSFIAMVQGPDGKTYMIKQGEKLMDGLVRAVNAEGIIVVQDVSDPLSLVKQREVSKKLRSLEAK
jgi:type IV pilus assembly protein PilP